LTDYGCLGTAKGACANKVLVRRTLAEDIILHAVSDRLSTPEPLRFVLERVEEEVRKLCSHVPETIRERETELAAEERRLLNFIDFIADGRGSRALADALSVTEKKVESLKEELNGLRSSSERVFQAPPIEWIEERVAGLKEVLKRRTEVSALLLRRLLG
jgi:hypothetical protein